MSRPYVEAWNSHDPANVLACMTEDVVLDDRGLGERMEGPDAVRDMLVDMAETFSSDFRFDLGQRRPPSDTPGRASRRPRWARSGQILGDR